MAASAMPVLAGTLLVDDGSCTPGAVPAYNSSGAILQSAPSRPSSGLGGTVSRLQLLHGRNDNGTVLDATGASGTFNVANTTGTSLLLSTEGAKNNTKTDLVIFDWVVPQFYKAGDNLAVTVNAKAVANGGTLGTKTVLAKAYKLADAGTSGADLIAASASALTTNAADYAFTITGTSLSPGDRVVIQLTAVCQETANAGSNSTVQINSVRIS